MISISRLLCNNIGPSDYLRYDRAEIAQRPIIVWNLTRQCNLRCLHCYASAGSRKTPGEMSTEEGKVFIGDLAEFGVPALLLSGGEPLLRQDIFELSGFARQQGIRIVLSTNGTLITERIAEKISRVGFSEVGISLDGIGRNNDHFRGQRGAFKAALQGIKNCVNEGLRVSLRLTITRFNYREIPAIFRLVEEEHIDRVCFYHLTYSGRADSIREEDLSHAETRAVVDTICEQTQELHRRGMPKEILTVANHADGVYLYLKLRKQEPARASSILALLKKNGGNNSGIRIGAVDDLGNVHPDQFWWHHSLGNVLKRKFGDIWMDTGEPLMRGLKNRKGLLKGRCARCHYLDLCNGNLRVRAEAVFGDVWAEDPACYLSDEEIGL